MAIRDIIAHGIGFSPGSVEFIVTHGFGAGEAAPVAGAGVPGRASRRPVAEVLLQQLTPPTPVHYAHTGRVTVALAYAVGAEVVVTHAPVAFAFAGAVSVGLRYRMRSDVAHRQRWVADPAGGYWARLRTRDERRRREEAELLGVSGGGRWDG